MEPDERAVFRRRIGAKIRQARIVAGFSQAGLADRLGISRPGAASIEAGRQGVTVEQLLVICDTLGITLAQVVTLHGDDSTVDAELNKYPPKIQEYIRKLKDESKARRALDAAEATEGK